MPKSSVLGRPLQTRRRARLCSEQQQQFPNLPTSVQLVILDHVTASLTEPDRSDYGIWPYKSTLGWLLSLRLVCKQWDHHIRHHPACIRRCRLEVLRNLSLQHDYAHIIVTSRSSKSQRLKAVPRSLTIRFDDNSSTNVVIPKPEPDLLKGLPLNTLMIVAACDTITIDAFLQLLADIDCLDQHHAAPMVIIITRPPETAAKSRSISSKRSAGCSQPNSHHPYPSSVAAGPTPGASQEYAASLQQLIDAATPSLQNDLKHVVMEGTAASKSLYFIPTKTGFCRRVPIAR